MQNALQYLGYIRDDQAYQVNKVSSKSRQKAGRSRPPSRNMALSFSKLDASPSYEPCAQGQSCMGQESRYHAFANNESLWSMGAESSQVSSSNGRYVWSKWLSSEKVEGEEGQQHQHREVERPQWAPGRLTTKGPMNHKDAPLWKERHHVSGSSHNPLRYYLERSYFDKLPTTRVDPHARHCPRSHRGNSGAASSKHGTGTHPAFSKDYKRPAKKPPAPRHKKTVQEESDDVVQKDTKPVVEPEILKKLEAQLRRSLAVPTNTSSRKAELREFVVFYHWAIQNFSNLTRCWKVLDRNLNMKMNRNEFLTTLKEKRFRGNAHLIFTLLDRDMSGSLMYYHFDPTGALDLAQISQWANKTFGSMQKAFKALDTDGNGQLTLAEFSSGAVKSGMASSSVHALFNMIDVDHDEKISINEIRFLDTWPCPAWLTVQPDVDAARHFEHTLLSKYKNNSILTWRLALDLDGNMRVSWDEFEKAVATHRDKKIGNLSKRLPGIWRVFDENLSG